MKAPNKIYIDDLAVVNDCITKISTTFLPNFSEYVRKDALLKWAKERLDFACALKSEGQKTVCEELIDKIESL